ncbi:MAG: ABC transporter permease subunit [Actinomycetota bacterium]
MSQVWAIARQTFWECTRRRVFVVVPVVTLLFIGLFALGAHYAFRQAGGTIQTGARFLDARSLIGATLMGLAMFTSLFLGSALAIFLTFGAVRGDAEQGILQQLVVRPVARSGLLLGRFLGASILCVVYIFVLYLGSVLVVGLTGQWWPDPLLTPGLSLAAAIPIVIGLSLLGSIYLGAIPNGIAMFMVYGAGLMAGLLGQLGDLISSPALENTGKIAAWALPFEALYQSGLNTLTSGATGITRIIVQLGPLGGAQPGGPLLLLWCALYLVLIGSVALWSFSRRDL